MFLDVASRKCWVYLLNFKSEIYDIFKWWKAVVEKQSEKKVKCLRTDQGGEYLSNSFQDFLRYLGIKHEVTVARTPQQNGWTERLNRTQMEMSRSMTNVYVIWVKII
jgi:transposase InsO family protein